MVIWLFVNKMEKFMLNTKKQCGFTIIELLFLIAIFSVVITIGVSCFSKNAEKIKIQKMAAQMQTITQAGVAYYADNGFWPTGNTSSNNEFYTKYLGSAIVNNPWGRIYSFSGEQNNNFKVSSELPEIANAQQVAALLPNARASSNSTGAEVEMYFQSKTSPMLYLNAVGSLTPDPASFQYCNKGSTKLRCDVTLAPKNPIRFPCIAGTRLKLMPLITSTDFVIPFVRRNGVLTDPYSVFIPTYQDGDKNITVRLERPYHRFYYWWSFGTVIDKKKDLGAVDSIASFDYLAFCVPNP
jgi:type II secretory pathway pseudopilin PulG